MDVTLCLTHACNLACSYCYGGRKLERHMPAEVAERALQMVADHDSPSIEVGFFGGEPLLVFDLVESYTLMAIERLASGCEALNFTVTTNGSLLTSEQLEFFARHDFFVALSMDGTRTAHDAARKYADGRGSFDAVDAALTALLESQLRFEVVAVVDPANVRYLGESVRYLVDRGVKTISLNPNFSAEWGRADREHWRRGYQEAADVFIDCFRNGFRLELNILDEKIMTHLDSGFKVDDRCRFGEGAFAVAPSGNLYPCERLVAEDADPTYCIGNVFDGFSHRLGELSRQLEGGRSSECERCTVHQRCMNWCPCQNIADSGCPEQPGPTICWHDQALIEIADRAAAILFKEENPLFRQRFYSDVCG